MNVPKHLWRSPTKEAIESLSNRFNLPNTSEMQDWEWEVADQKRIIEFIEVYKSGVLSEDERFTLMETIIQSFAESDDVLNESKGWNDVVDIIKENLDLHIHTVWYWADEESNNETEQWSVTPDMRKILSDNRDKYA